MAATANPDEQLAWEAKWRVHAAAAAVGAGVLTLGGGLYSQTQISGDFPTVGELQALTPALQGQIASDVNPGSAGVEYLSSKAGELIATSVVMGIGTVLAGFVLLYLFRATKARRPETPEVARYTAVFGSIVVALMGIALQVIISINANDFVNGTDRTRDAVEAVHSDGGLVIVQALALAGQLAFAFSFVLISLNAMRAGLLTRFMGVLGIIVGVLFVIPIGSPLPVVQCFWLLALAPLFLHRWPSGMPPAWVTGEAVAWPSQQEMREQRLRQRGGEPAPAGGAPEPDEPAPTAGELGGAADPAPAPRSSSARKRRKRR
jgi:hypothetical protein